MNGVNGSSRSPEPFRSRSGSILLITLLLVSLLMIVVMAFSVYVRMSLREVVLHQQHLDARAAARLGMNLALGELQHVAGPDQRVTARADLLDGTGTYRPGLTAESGQAMWTGVWDSSSFDETDPTNKPFLRWLVSGEDVSALADPARVGAASAGDLVTVVGTGSAGMGREVDVEKEQLDSGRSFAWWVGDEGVKARFDSLDPYRSSGTVEGQLLAVRGGQRHAMEVLEVGQTPAGDPILLGDDFPVEEAGFQEKMRKLALREQIALMAEGQQAEESFQNLTTAHFHDVTTYSSGVLANVKDGGLRQDLSLAFEMPYDDWLDSEFVTAHPHAEAPLYQPVGYPAGRPMSWMYRIETFPFSVEAGPVPTQDPPVPFVYDANDEFAYKTSLVETSAPVLRGPSWDYFRNFYRMYKSNDPDLSEYGQPVSASLDASGRMAGRSPFPTTYGLGSSRRYGQDSLAWDYAEIHGPPGTDYTRSVPIGRPLLPGVSPVVTRVQTAMNFRTRLVGNANSRNQYELDMYIDPIVTLWNPYSVPLKTGRDFGQPLVLSVMFLNLELNVRAAHPDGGRPTMRRAFGNPNNENDRNTILGRYAEPDSAFNPHGEQMYQLELDLGNRVLQPGEIVVFSHQGNRAVNYWRDEFHDPNADGYRVAGP